MQNTSPLVWYTQTPPTAVNEYSLYFWLIEGGIQIGVVGKYPVTSGQTRTHHPVVLLNSPEKDYPDVGLYATLAKQLVSAWRLGRLVIEWYDTVDATPPAISDVILNQPSTAKQPIMLVRIWYTSSAAGITQHVHVTDEYGFVLGSNSVVIEQNIQTSPTYPTGGDVLSLPIATSTTGNGITDTTVFPVVGTSLSPSQYTPIKARWYGTLPDLDCPSQVSGQEVALWIDGYGQYRISVSIPAHDALTPMGETIVSGIIPGVSTSGPCLLGKWWYMPMTQPLDITLPKVIEIMYASNNGLLFCGARTEGPISVANVYSPIPGAYTINYNMLSAPFPPSGINTQYSLWVEIVNSAGSAEWTSVRAVRVECTNGNTVVFPNDYDKCSTDCNDKSDILAAHGPSSGINVAQGRGSIPTGTVLTTGISRWSHLGTVNTVADNTSIAFGPGDISRILGTNVLYLPYMGQSSIIHRNTSTRTTALGYDTYYYATNHQPLAMGFSNDLIANMTAAQINDLMTKTVWLVSDDEIASAAYYTDANTVVLFTTPLESTQYQQADTKHIYYFGPNASAPEAEGTISQHDTYSVDWSKDRVVTPLFNDNYSTVMVSSACQIVKSGTSFLATRETLSGKMGFSVWRGFSGSAGDTTYRLTHTITVPETVPSGASRHILTAVCNYPEYAVPFTSSVVGERFDTTDAPFYPTFTGTLPTNFKMLWVEWDTVTDTEITLKYWDYTLSTPGVHTLVLPLAIANGLSVLVYNGSVTFTLEVSENNGKSNVIIYAGDTLVAIDTTGSLPWIPRGSYAVHMSGDASAFAEAAFGSVSALDEHYTSPLSSLQHRDYLELQFEEITTPITATSYKQMDLKPYTLYWDSVAKELYLPIMRSNDPLHPIQLAKTTFFKSFPITYPPVVDLVDHDSRGEHIYLSDGHGLGMIPNAITAEVFTSTLIDTTRSAIQYYWRRELDYQTIIGPFIATVVSGVEVPLTVKSTGVSGNAKIPTSIPYESANSSIQSKRVTLTQSTNYPTYVTWPMYTAYTDDAIFSIRFNREQRGGWESTFTTLSHFGVYLMPTPPSYQLYQNTTTKSPLPYPQLGGVRILFPRDIDGKVLVQVANYRGYGWSTELQTQGNLSFLPFDGNTSITIEGSNKNGKMHLNIYENGTIKYSVDTPMDYFNNGSLLFTLQGGVEGAREVLSNMAYSNTSAIENLSSGLDAGYSYCSPTQDLHVQVEVSPGGHNVVYDQSITTKYGYADIHLINPMAYTITADVYISSNTIPGVRDLIGRHVIKPDDTIPLRLLYIHRQEKIYIYTEQSGLQVRVDTLCQL